MSEKKPGNVKKPTGKGTAIKEVVFRYLPAHYYLGAFVACFAFILYFNSLKNGYVLDDYSAITINRYVQEGFAGIPKLMKVDFWHFSNMKLGYYRPLSLVTFAIEHQFFGASPWAGHFFNVTFFALGVFFVFLVMARLFSSKNLFFPLFISLLFAAHPIHTEVVDNIKGRDELLSFFNLMVMLFFSLRYAGNKKFRDLPLGMLFFYLALLSKESALTGILLLPLALYYGGLKKIKELAIPVLPFLLVVFLFFIQRRMALGPGPAIIPDDIINYPYREEAVRFSTAFLLFIFSVKMLFWPHPLRYDYSYNQIPAVGWDNVWALLGFLLFLALIVLFVSQIRKKTFWGLATGFFLVAMAPVMGFIILRGGIFAERNIFTASLGTCMIVVILTNTIFGAVYRPGPMVTARNWGSRLPVFLFIILAVTMGSVITVKRNTAWVDSLTLFRTDIATGKNSAQNQLHYGSDMVIQATKISDKNEKDSLVTAGMSAIRQALAIHPRFGDAMFRYAYGYEVKLTYKPEQRYVDSAVYFFNKAIEYAPSLADAYRHLGLIYEWLQRYDVASYYYNRAFQVNPQLLSAKQKADELRATRGLDVKVNPLTAGKREPVNLRY